MMFDLPRYTTAIRHLAVISLITFGLLSILASGGGGGGSSVSPTSAQIDLSLTNTVDNATPAVGANVVFTLTVDNAAGMSNATAVIITDPLPSGYAYVSDDGGATTAVAGNTVTWNVDNLAAGTNAVLNITAQVLSAGVYQNDAEVTAATETDIDSTPGDGTGDDFASAMSTPVPSLYFHATDGVNGVELWQSDGTKAGTVLVKDINAGAGDSFPVTVPADFTAFNGALYFRADDGVNGVELWRSDGTAAGTALVKDINTGAGWSNTNLDDRFTVFNGALYFSAFDGVNVELWKTDGTAAGTTLVKDINAGVGDSNPVGLTVFNGALYFSADDGVNGVELWRSDGTDPVKDINAGVGDSNPANLTVLNGALYFSADDGVNGVELWRSDGTPAGTMLVKDIRPTSGSQKDSVPQELTVLNNVLYFSANDGMNGRELWRSDGTDTFMVKNINNVGAGKTGSNPIEFTAFNGALYFSADDGVNGRELWKSDGTDAGTMLVKDINAGAGDSFPVTVPADFTAFNGALYFRADDGVNGRELWKSDGTDAGTMLVKDINAGAGNSNPTGFTVLNGTLYFSADDGVNGMELWKSDGTPGGTMLVKDIHPVGDSNPAELTGF